MTPLQLVVTAVSCAVLQGSLEPCLQTHIQNQPVAGIQTEPVFSGESIDVILSAQAALVWDVRTGAVLYERNAQVRRPVASLSKLASVLVAREILKPSELVVIPPEAAVAQRRGTNIRLPVGQHALVQDLLGASLTPSANDAMVTLAVAASGSEDAFIAEANRRLPGLGAANTKLANSTGLQGGEQYSTAQDVRTLLTHLTQDNTLRSFLAAQKGVLVTQEGSRRAYITTNKLLGTYLPVIAAKTGFTNEAGENLALLTRTDSGHEVGAVILGSDQRFQDMKVLVAWVQRNYSW